MAIRANQCDHRIHQPIRSHDYCIQYGLIAKLQLGIINFIAKRLEKLQIPLFIGIENQISALSSQHLMIAYQNSTKCRENLKIKNLHFGPHPGIKNAFFNIQNKNNS